MARIWDRSGREACRCGRRRRPLARIGRGAVLACIAATAGPSFAQPAQPRAYTLEEAVAEALGTHPRLAEARANREDADARVGESRTLLLPDVAVSAEINRSTGNTPSGAFFLAPGFVPISGAPRGKTLDEGVWQTGASVYATWDVLSLSRQAAAVDAALAGRTQATATIDVQRLEVAYQAADAFLLELEAEAAVRAVAVNVQRAEVLVTATKPLVVQNLRPGVDEARAEAELANAQTQLARAEQTREVRRAELAEALGHAGATVDAQPGPLLGPVDQLRPTAARGVADHPDVLEATAAASRVAEGRRLVEVEYLPRLNLVAALWARGSGFLDSPASGLIPDIPNWAAGAVATWSILDIPAIRARARVVQADYAAALARRDEVVLADSGQLARATAVVEGAMRVAQQTPTALASARAAEQQALARYQSGLSPVVDVADAQRVLAQAEIDDAVARLEVRRALLLLARAAGDLGPFLAQSRAAGG
jgi:outer membrane protein